MKGLWRPGTVLRGSARAAGRWAPRPEPIFSLLVEEPHRDRRVVTTKPIASGHEPLVLGLLVEKPDRDRRVVTIRPDVIGHDSSVLKRQRDR